MRIVFLLLIGIHGLIHLFGFLKAYGLAEFTAITQPISKFYGIIWLVSSVLFVVTVVLLLFHANYGWLVGLIAVILSQIIIVIYWNDAKYGTVLNLLILIVILVSYLTYSFQRKVDADNKQILSEINPSKEIIITEQMIEHLPVAVQNWLLKSGAVGKQQSNRVSLVQELQMLMKPEQEEWKTATAKQLFTINPPAFNWAVVLKMNAIVEVVGQDKFENGKGAMTMKLFSTIPIVKLSDNPKLNEATLQRYLAEIVWFPSASLSPYITWEHIDNSTAVAIMNYKGIVGKGVFYFDKKGDFKKFVANRYKDVKDTVPTQWTVTATKTAIRNGIRIPVESNVQWKLENQNWTWLKVEIIDIVYNP